MNFEQWLRSRNIDPATLTAERRAELQAEFQRHAAGANPSTATSTPAQNNGHTPVESVRSADPAPVPVLNNVVTPAESVRSADPAPAPVLNNGRTPVAERERIRAIQNLAAGLDGLPAELVNRAIDEELTLERAGLVFLEHMRASRPQPVAAGVPAIHSRNHEADCTERAIADGLLIRAGLDRIAGDLPDADRATRARQLEQGSRYRSMSMLDVCREACRIGGVRGNPYNPEETIRSAVSTAALINIFTAVTTAQLMQSWSEAPDTSEQWVSRGEVPDFKKTKDIQLGTMAALQRLPRGMEAQHASRGDEAEEYQIARYAAQLVVDEQDIIDDMFNALLDSPMEMGRAARQLQPDLVYALLLANPTLGADSTAVFHDDHANNATGALGETNVQAAIVAMSKQKIGDRTLNIRPKFLLLPPDLIFTARIILQSEQRIISANSGGTLNPLADENIMPVSEARLGTGGVTDPATGTAYTGTATNWFMAAAPGSGPTVKVATLRGRNRAPRIRAFALDKGRWGVGWDINHDIGAYVQDYRGLYKSTGAG